MKYKVGDKVTISDVRKIRHGIISAKGKYKYIGKKAVISAISNLGTPFNAFPYSIRFEDGTHIYYSWRDAEFGEVNGWKGDKNKWQKNL